jgi:hypothetical protein
MGQMHNGCILCGPTGTGKSVTALAYYLEHYPEHLLVIITTAKKRDSKDWESDCYMLGIDPEYMVVDSWNNIGNYEDKNDYFFIFDEQRVVGSGAWVKAFLKIAKRNQWVLLSATPGDTWTDYIPVFIANGFYKNRTEFIQRHVTYRPYVKFPSILRYNDVGHLLALKNQILIFAPFRKHTVQHDHEITVDFDGPEFRRIFIDRWNAAEDRPIRNASEWFALMRRNVNTHPSRIEELKSLLAKHPRLIVFYNFDYELELLHVLADELGEDGIQTAEWNGHKHESVPDEPQWLYFVQYQAASEAWECIDTDAEVFFSQTYSYRRLEQARGRVDRMTTPFTDLHYYHFLSDTYIDKVIAKSLRKKKDFNEKDYYPGKVDTDTRVPVLQHQ